MKTQHTPTPWEVREGDSPQVTTKGNVYSICTMYGVYSTKEEKSANATFIVKAVNWHKALITIAKAYVELTELHGAENGNARKIIAQAEVQS